jgi:hypothetical protein
MDYSFLNGLTLVDTGRQRTPKTKTPEGLTLRIFPNGEVYPSADLVNKFNLEYGNKDEQAQTNGIDVIDSSEWIPTAQFPRMIIFGFVPKTEAKIDLFGTCRYNEDGTPKSSVYVQGSTSPMLLELVRSMGYLTDDQKYCDLQVVTEYPITMKDGIATVPKVVERGANKGEKTYERRENITFYPVNTPENLKATATQTPATAGITSTVANDTVTN